MNNYELVTMDETGEEKVYTKEEINFLEEKKKEGEIGDRLDRMEDLLLKIISTKGGRKTESSEQITNRLNRIESMLNNGRRFVYTSDDDSPVVEELEDKFIPEIDLGEMQISGKTTEVVEKTLEDDIEGAVDMLSRLRVK